MPLILEWDISGVIRKVGSKVTDLTVRTPVIAPQQLDKNGGYADFVAINQNTVVKKPESLLLKKVRQFQLMV